MNKLYEGLFSHWEYNLPPDPEKQLYDFYFMVTVLSQGIGGNDRNMEDLIPELEKARDTLVTSLTPLMMKAVTWSLSCEFRHVYGNLSGYGDLWTQIEHDKLTDPVTIDFLKRYTIYYKGKDFLQRALNIAWHSEPEEATGIPPEAPDVPEIPREVIAPVYQKGILKKQLNKAGQPYGSSEDQNVDRMRSFRAVQRTLKSLGWMETKQGGINFGMVCLHVFDDLAWTGSYGGRMWGSGDGHRGGVAKAFTGLAKAKTIQEKIIWLDACYDAQHNTGAMLNKVRFFYSGGGGGYEWLAKALDWKAGKSRGGEPGIGTVSRGSTAHKIDIRGYYDRVSGSLKPVVAYVGKNNLDVTKGGGYTPGTELGSIEDYKKKQKGGEFRPAFGVPKQVEASKKKPFETWFTKPGVYPEWAKDNLQARNKIDALRIKAGIISPTRAQSHTEEPSTNPSLLTARSAEPEKSEKKKKGKQKATWNKKLNRWEFPPAEKVEPKKEPEPPAKPIKPYHGKEEFPRIRVGEHYLYVTSRPGYHLGYSTTTTSYGGPMGGYSYGGHNYGQMAFNDVEDQEAVAAQDAKDKKKKKKKKGKFDPHTDDIEDWKKEHPFMEGKVWRQGAWVEVPEEEMTDAEFYDQEKPPDDEWETGQFSDVVDNPGATEWENYWNNQEYNKTVPKDQALNVSAPAAKPYVTPKDDEGVAQFIEELKSRDITTVAMLLTDEDIAKHYDKSLVTYYEEAGIKVMRFPIEDRDAPKDARKFHLFMRQLNERLKTENVVLHCSAGLGRTGTALAGFLIYHGYSYKDAMKTAKRKRAGAVETQSQEKFLRVYEKYVTIWRRSMQKYESRNSP